MSSVPTLESLSVKELRWVSLANEVKQIESLKIATRLAESFAIQIETAIRSEPKNGWLFKISTLVVASEVLAATLSELTEKINTGFTTELKYSPDSYCFNLFIWLQKTYKPTTFAGYQLSPYSTIDIKRITESQQPIRTTNHSATTQPYPSLTPIINHNSRNYLHHRVDEIIRSQDEYNEFISR